MASRCPTMLPRPFPGITEFIAPGCYEDSGRRPSGLCGLWTVGVAGVPVPWHLLPRCLTVCPVEGMSGNAAPGAFTPTKLAKVRFLDAHHTAHVFAAGSHNIELNRKFDDTGLRAHARAVDSHLGQDFIAGAMGLWAWHGRWQDKNGNGVIDSFYNDPQQAQPLAPWEEFAWFGNCLKFSGLPNPRSVDVGFCAYDTEAAAGGTTRMLGFLFPGNHHALCGGTIGLGTDCFAHPADLPGRQVVHLLAASGIPSTFFAPWRIEDLDPVDEAYFGDPLLGPQGSVAPDQEFSDRTGDPSLGTREWVYGLGWPAWFYDQSLLVGLVQVTTVGCQADAANPNRVLMGTCRFADVDAFRAASPTLEALLQDQLEPALRSHWVFARDNWPALSADVGGLPFRELTRASPLTGPLDDAAYNPGWSHEPNTPLDQFPGARFNARGCPGPSTELHHGWCNDYAPHRAGPHAYGDLLAIRLLYTNQPIGLGNCILCVSGGGLATNYAGEAPAGSPAPLVHAPGDHRRMLGPGQYAFGGFFGAWHDRAQTWEEQHFDLATLATVPRAYLAPPDSWVGNIVNATGTSSFPSERCTTDQGPGPWPYAFCHPYLDGNLENPQEFGYGEAPHGEWKGRCDGGVVARHVDVVLRPADGRWDVPVLVWREHLALINLLDPGATLQRIEDWTGHAGDIVLEAYCGYGGRLGVADLLILPAGNVGETLHTIATVRVGAEEVTDADVYHAWVV